MYMILLWVTSDYVTSVCNASGSVKLFDKLKEADEYANENFGDNARVITIEGVSE